MAQLPPGLCTWASLKPKHASRMSILHGPIGCCHACHRSSRAVEHAPVERVLLLLPRHQRGLCCLDLLDQRCGPRPRFERLDEPRGRAKALRGVVSWAVKVSHATTVVNQLVRKFTFNKFFLTKFIFAVVRWRSLKTEFRVSAKWNDPVWTLPGNRP